MRLKNIQLIKINEDISHDVGYAGEIGVLVSKETYDEKYYYFLAYDNRAKRYWNCGIKENEFTFVYDKSVYEENLSRLIKNLWKDDEYLIELPINTKTTDIKKTYRINCEKEYTEQEMLKLKIFGVEFIEY